MSKKRNPKFTTRKNTMPESTSHPAPTNKTPRAAKIKLKLKNTRKVSKSFKPLRKPNREQARVLVSQFGGGSGSSSQTSLVFKPSKQDAHLDPWVHLDKKEVGAASRSMTKGMVLRRMQGNVQAANKQIEEFSGKVYSKRGWGQLANELVGIYEMYFSRRTALLKELEICRAEELLALEA